MSEYHFGRLIDHVHLRVADLEASKRFYRATLGALGRELIWECEEAFAADELFVSADGPPTEGLHIAFQAPDREAVHRFHEAALAAGGRDNGVPASGRTTPATTVPTRSIRMATTSRPSTTDRASAPPSRSS
jgi:catechol 2,3-dioxygenase-like lactoylglutathione lyase family enzyme